MEQYYYLPQNATALVPKVFYENKKHWYAEVRYNYEELQTGSVHFGKTFRYKKEIDLTITPIAGIVFGAINGGSAGLQMEIAYQKLWFFSEPQYFFSKDKLQNFTYAWSEACYEISDKVYAGLALQQTKLFNEKLLSEPGIMLGICFKNFELPVYYFNPAKKNEGYFVVGVNWSWDR